MTFPQSKPASRIWWANDAAERDAIGSSDGLDVGDLVFVLFDNTFHRCTSVDGGDASTWAAAGGVATWNEAIEGGSSSGVDINTPSSGGQVQISGGDLLGFFQDSPARAFPRVRFGPAEEDLDGDVFIIETRNRSDGVEGQMRIRAAPSTVHADWALQGVFLASRNTLSDPTPEADVDIICGDPFDANDHYINILSGNTNIAGIKFGDSNDANFVHVEHNNSGDTFRIRIETATDDHTTTYDTAGVWLMPAGLGISGGDPANGPLGSENLGIGDGTASAGIAIFTGTSDTGSVIFQDAANGSQGAIFYAHGNNQLRFQTASTQRWLIDSSGNLRPFANETHDIGEDGFRPSFVFQGTPSYDVTAALDNQTFALDDDGIVLVAAATGVVNLDLPASTAANRGKSWVIIVQDASNAVNLRRNGTDTINTAAADDVLVGLGEWHVRSLGNGDNSNHGPIAIV